MATDKKDQDISFEQALARIEEIVKSLESGQAPLEEEIGLYEEAVRLTELCSKKLKDAELKIRTLQSGETQEAPTC